MERADCKLTVLIKWHRYDPHACCFRRGYAFLWYFTATDDPGLLHNFLSLCALSPFLHQSSVERKA